MSPGRSIPKRAIIVLGMVLLVVPLALWRSHGKSPIPGHSQPRPPIHLTFLVASDTHLGLDSPEDPSRDVLKQPTPIEQRNLAMIERMNTLAGTPLPPALGGSVETPRALLVTGDLTEDGEEGQWRSFAQLYGLNGRDGLLHLPVYESGGNHDHQKAAVVAEHIRARHGGPNYAFDLGGIHFISLGEAPDDQGLAFLGADLRTKDATTPLILCFHLPLQGPWAERNWFGQGNYRERLRTLLAGRKVLAIFHGHSHITSAYRWNGIDVYNPGSVKHSQRAFLVVDIRGEAMTVAAWNLDFEGWWWWHRKSLAPASAKLPELVGLQAPGGFQPQPYFLLQPR